MPDKRYLPPIRRICETCGNAFRAWPFSVAKGKSRYCSKACAPGGAPVRDVATRFWEKVHQTDTCWLWTGKLNAKGYGRFQVDGKVLLVHRVAYQLFVGPIPDDLACCHHCDTPACVRPDHLFLGTLSENNHDMQRKARGKPYGRGGKLTADDVRTIRALYGQAGWDFMTIARRFGVTDTAIRLIIARRNWAHLDETPC